MLDAPVPEVKRVESRRRGVAVLQHDSPERAVAAGLA
jgi:hypothetical protein